MKWRRKWKWRDALEQVKWKWGKELLGNKKAKLDWGRTIIKSETWHTGVLRIRGSLLLQCAPSVCGVFSVCWIWFFSCSSRDSFPFTLGGLEMGKCHPDSRVVLMEARPLHHAGLKCSLSSLLIVCLNFVVFQPLLAADFGSPDPIAAY